MQLLHPFLMADHILYTCTIYMLGDKSSATSGMQQEFKTPTAQLQVPWHITIDSMSRNSSISSSIYTSMIKIPIQVQQIRKPTY